VAYKRRRIGKGRDNARRALSLAPKPGDPTTTYSTEDIRIQQYSDTAAAAFRLVGKTEKDGRTVVTNYLDSRTFLKRNGKLHAVSWQATKSPRSRGEVKEVRK
jgi:hypothetical protein